jgi:Cellulose binding domain
MVSKGCCCAPLRPFFAGRAPPFTMTKTWQRRALCVYLTLGLPLAASCAKEENTLEGDDTATGATTSSGGNTSNAGSTGSTGSTGKAGSGTTSAFGGTNSTGGSAGGKTGTAGNVATGGGSGSSAGGKTSGGTGGGGGGGGASMVPADVLARASAIVLYQTTEVAEMDKTIQMQLFIKNQSPDPLPMSHVKIRYWFTAEVSTSLHQYYTGPEAQLPKAVFVDAAANSHVLMTFGGGSIVMGGDINRSQIQLVVDNNMSPFNQKDDFSWNPADKGSTPNDKITLYLDDKLIWGCEPSGACFDDAAGGAGAGGAANGAGGAP